MLKTEIAWKPQQPFLSNVYYPPQFHWERPQHCRVAEFMIAPQGVYTGTGMGFGALSLGTAFKFRSRHEGVDWRRFSAIDVDRVARELDVATLQENIMSVTFCNLDSERCQWCQNAVDPVLLKVFKLAQLNTEYLLHSQELFTSSIQALEEQLQTLTEELEKSKQEMVKQAEELKAVKEESRRRKKMITTLQLLVQAGANNYHKCQFCDKAFLNYSFLQGHVERRHPEITEAERKKKHRTEQIEDEIRELRERLQISQSQLRLEREADSLRRGQELEDSRRREEDVKKEFENWKEEERKKFFQEMESLRQELLAEFQDIAEKNQSIEAKLQEIQVAAPALSTVTSRIEDHATELRNWKERYEKLKNDSKKKVKDFESQHLADKEEMKAENERLRATLSADQKTTAEYFQKQISSLSAKVKEQSAVIWSQEDQIRKLSSRPVQDAPACDVLHVTHLTPLGHDPAMSLSSSASESQDLESEEDDDLESSLDRKQQLLNTLRQNPKFIKQFRPILEETLEEKLESMGLKKGLKGIPAQTLKSLSVTVGKQRESKARHFGEFASLRKRFAKVVVEKVREKQRSEGYSSPPPRSVRRQTGPAQKTATKSKGRQAVTLKPSRVVDPKLSQTEVPKPAPRHRAASPIRSAAPSASTPPFSSDEDDSVVDSAYVTSVGVKDGTQVRVVQSNPLPRPSALSDDDDDWSDTDISTELLSPVGGASVARTPPGNMVQSLAKSLERQLSSPVKKPTGGVQLIPTAQAAARTPPDNRTVVKKLQLSDNDESDLDISSIEEVSEEFLAKAAISKPVAAPRQSAEPSISQGTSAWSSSTSRGAGLKEAGTVMSLKSSSFATVTDISDSEFNFP
ncbi:zinc finger protein DZIP1L-like isoform X2 [Chiloscyllium plagiosum]|uniref:zinc finger protein DZIP1L-like isoform X2 n=1 Tax=Chiloscyllium plagiosum TaxID=36176 RepID=UPI001CB86BAE|nr:zinc finger protein DZIP1L-like isoform X2 [Chiloscyllium plagiosum]